MFIEQTASDKSLAGRKTIYNVGVNDANYIVKPRVNGERLCCPFYQSWWSMMQRCYSEKLHAKFPTYADCSACDEWLTFSNFRAWMETQDWENKSLDKDILVVGNKVYSPETCLFIDQSVNALMSDRAGARGEYPIGAYFHKPNNKFAAKCCVYGKNKHLGSFDTPEEAHEAYKQFKSKHILEVAEKYKNEHRLYEALKNHARIILLTP